jgi:hypothetical protein
MCIRTLTDLFPSDDAESGPFEGPVMDRTYAPAARDTRRDEEEELLALRKVNKRSVKHWPSFTEARAEGRGKGRKSKPVPGRKAGNGKA